MGKTYRNYQSNVKSLKNHSKYKHRAKKEEEKYGKGII